MDLREEYKKSMESSSPDRQTMDRMKAAVYARLEAGEGQPGIPGEKRRPINRFAYIGGAAAACAIIAVSAATILPNVSKNNNMIHDSSMATGAVSAEESCGHTASAVTKESAFAADTAQEFTDETIGVDGITDTDSTGGAYDITADESPFTADIGADDAMDDAPAYITEEVDDDGLPNPNAGGDDRPNPDWGGDNGSPDRGDASENPSAGGPDNVEPSDNSTATAEQDEVVDEPEDSGDKSNSSPTFSEGTGEIDDESCEIITADSWDGTVDLEMTTEVTMESDEENVATILFGRDWITFAGERYKPVSSKPLSGSTVPAYDPITKKYYNVISSGDVITVYCEGALVGSYKKM